MKKKDLLQALKQADDNDEIYMYLDEFDECVPIEVAEVTQVYRNKRGRLTKLQRDKADKLKDIWLIDGQGYH